ncbi:MAG: response regulator transcription factor [Chitinophagaceae bacterium]|nr:response regulator transcription factor [Chitinophagaceae bacterium]
MHIENTVIRIALADDHTLLRTALATVINKTGNFSVELEAGDGSELIEKIQNGNIPDVVLLDLNMPVFDGYETAKWLQQNFPAIHILMLTMYDTEPTMIRLLQAGVKGFLRKDTDINELRFAINSVVRSGYYYTNNTTGRLINLFRRSQEHSALVKAMLSEMEIKFLRWACTDLTYKEIAKEMQLNVRAVDNLRDNLFGKLDVKNRVGLVMYSIKHGIQTF